MKKGILILGLGLVIAGAGSLAAADASPEWLLNGDGSIGIGTAPAYFSGGIEAGAQGSVEYQPNIYKHMLGIDLGYDYLSLNNLSANKTNKGVTNASDNDVTLGLRLIPVTFANTSLFLLGTVGYNLAWTNETGDLTGHYLAEIEPGVRVMVASRVAIDAGLNFTATSPQSNFIQSAGVTVGVSIPLDGNFGSAPAADATPASGSSSSN